MTKRDTHHGDLFAYSDCEREERRDRLGTCSGAFSHNHAGLSEKSTDPARAFGRRT